MKTITFQSPFTVGDTVRNKHQHEPTFTVLGMRVEYFKRVEPELTFYLHSNGNTNKSDERDDYISHDRIGEYELVKDNPIDK